MKLSLKKLSQILLNEDIRYQLICHIAATQGFETARLDYTKAAEKLGVSTRTISRTVRHLADDRLLVIENDKLRLSKTLATV